jgi:ATP-dependent Clp protease ATP-binding subunit ClpC
MFERFTEKAIKVIMLGQEEARRLGHNFVGTEQILLGLIGEGTGYAAKVLKELGVNLKDARLEVEKIIGRGSGFVAVEIPFTPRAKRVLELALEEARQLGHNYIGTEHLLLGILREGEGVAVKVLENSRVDLQKCRQRVLEVISANQPGRSGGSNKPAKTPNLEAYGTDLTRSALEEKLDPLVGRDEEVQRLIEILVRRTKNNPVLIGEPGVGKTAIAEGLANLISSGTVPPLLADKRVVSLDIGLLVAGTKYRGEFEERLKKVMEEIRSSGNVILVIDEVHTLIGAGAAEGAIDAANILKPALARGELQCIGATTVDEYRKHIERDAALERRFQPILVEEPSVVETIEILNGLRSRYEKHHGLKITDEALVDAAVLSDRYIPDRFLPDKAIDMIDEASSRVRSTRAVSSAVAELQKQLKTMTAEIGSALLAKNFDLVSKLRNGKTELEEEIRRASQQVTQPEQIVTGDNIASVVASITGIPVTKLTETEAERLLHLEDELHQRVVGQHVAVEAVAQAVRRAYVGLKNPNRPIASFMFSGPTGVGKTELCKALAEALFSSEKAMIRLDMSEYMERHTVSKLIGSPPGYVGFNEGGQLTEAVRRRPYSVLLFDEIEKAHPDVFNMLLQILEDGRLTDSKGRVVDFKNTLIIMTSNVGSKVIVKGGGGGLGFELQEANQEEANYERVRNLVHAELKNYFRPEFLNRLDEVIVFRQLNRDEVSQIAEILLKEISGRMEKKQITLQITDRFKAHLVEAGYDPTYGARPLRRAIMKLIEDKLASQCLSGTIRDGDVVQLDLNEEQQVLVTKLEKDSSTSKAA